MCLTIKTHKKLPFRMDVVKGLDVVRSAIYTPYRAAKVLTKNGWVAPINTRERYDQTKRSYLRVGNVIDSGVIHSYHNRYAASRFAVDVDANWKIWHKDGTIRRPSASQSNCVFPAIAVDLVALGRDGDVASTFLYIPAFDQTGNHHPGNYTDAQLRKALGIDKY